MSMLADRSANITRIQITGTLGATFCPKDEKTKAPIAIGRK